jgi:hypothetical protein
MQPAHGGRLTLRLDPAHAGSVRYRAELELAHEVFVGAAQLSDGEVNFEPWSPGEPPAYWVDRVRALLRAQWRAGAPWPRRITRWRASPNAAADEQEKP